MAPLCVTFFQGRIPQALEDSSMANTPKRNGVNKSQAIRDLFTENSKASVKDIINTLGERGIKVQPSLVYFIKGKLKRLRRKQIGRRMKEAGVINPVELILKVRSLSREVGGIGKLKQLVDALSE